MPNRILVSGPSDGEERRQLAETISDLHYMACIVVENANELVPGEAVEELQLAWKQSEQSVQALIGVLQIDYEASETGLNPSILKKHELFGASGSLKRSTLRRLKDRFLMYWNSEPRTDEKRSKAAEAGVDYFEFAATLVTSIPGYEQIAEIMDLIKQLIGLRLRRGI